MIVQQGIPRRFAIMVDEPAVGDADAFTQWLNDQSELRYWHWFREAWLVVDHHPQRRTVDDWNAILRGFFGVGPFVVVRVVGDEAADDPAASGTLRPETTSWFNLYWFGDRMKPPG